jgi:hypothetical protein
MIPPPQPETMKIIATKAQRHQGFIYNKTFCVKLCALVSLWLLPGGESILLLL